MASITEFKPAPRFCVKQHMKNIILVIVVSILLGVPLAISAQDGVALGREIESSVKAKNAKRKLKESIPAGDHAEQTWSLEGKRISVLIYEFSSPEEATRNMDLSIGSIAYAPVTERPPGLGDAAHVSTDRRGTTTTLCFRRGKVFILIRATSLKVAKEFARDIADHLAKR